MLQVQIAGIIMEVKSINDLKLRILDEFPEIEHYNYRISLNNEILNSDRNLNEGTKLHFCHPLPEVE